MFTYLPEARVLFSCDFFGVRTVQEIYEEDIEEFIPLAKSYYGEIMMPSGRLKIKSLSSM
jgi:Uncharacterized flavoproteins